MGTVHKTSSSATSGRWSYPDVPVVDYARDASPGVTKQVLVGQSEGATDFVVRYFTVPAGGRSAYHQHRHQHGVVITHGSGRVLLGDQWHPIATGDAVFTDSNELHQFEASAGVALGFICVVPPWGEDSSPAR